MKSEYHTNRMLKKLESKALALGHVLESKALALGMFLESKALALAVGEGNCYYSLKLKLWTPE